MIAWKGHSLIGTKAKTQVVLTGIETASKNSKTLDMVQGYILVDQVDPVQAQKRGRDDSVHSVGFWRSPPERPGVTSSPYTTR